MYGRDGGILRQVPREAHDEGWEGSYGSRKGRRAKSHDGPLLDMRHKNV